eukprot:509833_1
MYRGFGDDDDIVMNDKTKLAYAKRSCGKPDRITNNQTCLTHEGIGCFIQITQTNPLEYDRIGTGVFISDEYIMTAKHVVCNGSGKNPYKFINTNLFFFLNILKRFKFFRMAPLNSSLSTNIIILHGEMLFRIETVHRYGTDDHDFALCKADTKWTEFSLNKHGISFVNFDHYNTVKKFNEHLLALPIRIDGYSGAKTFDSGTGSIRRRCAQKLELTYRSTKSHERFKGKRIVTKINGRSTDVHAFNHNVDSAPGVSGSPVFVCDENGYLVKK